MKYKRVLLKISGEALAGPEAFGVHAPTLETVAAGIKRVHSEGVGLGVVVGGGNIFRGKQAKELCLERASGDYMGMLATCINGVALQEALEAKGVQTRLQTALTMIEVGEAYIRRRALRHLEKKRVVIFAAGTGNPYFTTDTAAALRALEIKAEVLLKATQVEGIYTGDPKRQKGARLLKRISYMDVLQRGLQVMDSTAVSMCMDNQLPILAFNLSARDSLYRVVRGENLGTYVGNIEGDGTVAINKSKEG